MTKSALQIARAAYHAIGCRPRCYPEVIPQHVWDAGGYVRDNG